MTFTTYLTKQLTNFVEVYKKYFLKTYAAALGFTVVCFIVMAILLRFADFDPIAGKKQSSLLSYFNTRYSFGDIYSLVDLSKIVLIFFIALFSIAVSRFESDNKQEEGEISILTRIKFRDIVWFIYILILCSIVDYGLSFISNLTSHTMTPYAEWARGMIFKLRIYIPLILFSISIYRERVGKFPKMNLRKSMFLFASLWFFNEFAYEIELFAKYTIIDLILLPFGDRNTFVYVSVISIPIIAFWFLGYHSAMNVSMELLDEQEVNP